MFGNLDKREVQKKVEKYKKLAYYYSGKSSVLLDMSNAFTRELEDQPSHEDTSVVSELAERAFVYEEIATSYKRRAEIIDIYDEDEEMSLICLAINTLKAFTEDQAYEYIARIRAQNAMETLSWGSAEILAEYREALLWNFLY